MANNDTITIPEDQFSNLVISHSIYCCAGAVTFVANVFFLASIYRHALLRERKEYIVLSALVVADLLEGYAFFTSGITRIYYVWSGTINHLVTRTQCMAKPWNWAWFPFHNVYGATLLMVSVDRLLSISCPFKYLQWDYAYAFILMLGFYGPYVPVIVYAGYEALKDDERAYLSQICYSTMVYKDIEMNKILKAVQSNLAIASFVAYVAVVVLYRLRAKRMLATMSSGTQRRRFESQRDLMVTLGLSCVATAVLYAAPTMSLSVIGVHPWVYSLIVPCIALSHMVNALLFFWRHKTIRKAIHCLLHNQKLTQAMIDGQSNGQSTATVQPIQ